MNRFTTNSLAEYKKNPDLIYLDPRTMSAIGKPLKIRRCAYCKTELREGNMSYQSYNKYCGDWCREMGHSKHFELHKCLSCDKMIPYGEKKCDGCKLNKTTKYNKVKLDKLLK